MGAGVLSGEIIPSPHDRRTAFFVLAFEYKV